jgi:lysophospholipase
MERTENIIVFPAVPDVDTFVNLGLNKKPTFFGCDASNLTGQAPLIVYLPNAPYVYNSNVSTFDLQYNDTERNAIVLNGYNLATQGNGTIDSDWPSCVGCAILSRSFDRTGTKVPSVCRQCFKRYCWDGNTDNSSPEPYQPNSRLENVSVKSAAGRFTASAVLALAGAMFSTFLVL